MAQLIFQEYLTTLIILPLPLPLPPSLARHLHNLKFLTEEQ